MEQIFSIKEVLTFGWRQFKVHSGLLLQALLTTIAVAVVSSILNSMMGGTILGVVFNIVFAVISLFVGTGYTLITLKIARGEPALFRDIIPAYLLVWRYFLANLLVSLVIGGLAVVAILIGVIVFALLSVAHMVAIAMLIAGLLVIAGVAALIYIAIRYSFVLFAVLDGAKVMESIHRSAILTQGVKWKLAGFGLVVGLLNILGALCLLVGLLISAPVTGMALAKVYLILKARVEA